MLEENIVIIIICYGVGHLLRNIKKLPNEFIPDILMLVGALLSVGLFYMGVTDMTNILEAVAHGIANGLMSVGANQLVKQLEKYMEVKKL